MLLFRVYVMQFDVCHEITHDKHQTSLHKTETSQNTADIPQMSLHKHGTITQIICHIPQTSLHQHGQ
jgi:hypothetical protein